MTSLLRDLRYGVRSLVKSPGFSIVAIVTLALGIGANTAIFSVVQNVLLRPLPYSHPEALVEAWNTYMPQVPRAGLSPGDYADWCGQNGSFSEAGGYAEIPDGFNLTDEGEPQRVVAGYASASLFPLLGLRLAAGNFFPREADRPGSAPVVILSHRLWQSRFGSDPAVVGRTISLDDRRFTIQGVLPASFPLMRNAELWLPFGQYPDDLSEHIHHAFTLVGRLKPGVTLAQAREEILGLNAQEAITYPAEHKSFGVTVQQLQDPSVVRLRGTLLVLLGAVGLVLLIACANIVNLLLVRNASREKEIAIRTSLGASPWQLVRQLLSESLLLALAGGALGVAFAQLGLAALMRFAPGDLAILSGSNLDLGVLGFTLVVCAAAGVLSGLLPALRALRANLGGVLKEGSKGSSSVSHRRTHNLLVICEVSMALMPLIGAGLLLRSFQKLLEVAPGFQIERVLSLDVQQPSISFADYNKLSQQEQNEIGPRQALVFEQMAREIRALPGVKGAGGTNFLPLTSSTLSASRFLIEGQVPPENGARPVAQTRVASLTYFAAMGIPLEAGRTFVQDDWKLQNIVINEDMARRFWPGVPSNAVGKRVNLCSLAPKPCWFAIVGVVGDVRQLSLDGQPTYDVYFSGAWTPRFVVRATSDPAQLTAGISNIIHKFDPKLPITHVMTMDAQFSDSVSPRRFSAVLVGAFAILAVLLSAVGIYGVMSYTVGQRTQEIGIRMALGAQQSSVRGMILWQSLKLALAGVAAGLLGALALVRLLSALLFGVGVYDAVTFVCVPLVLIGVAIAAALLPARRATRVDPILALRSE